MDSNFLGSATPRNGAASNSNECFNHRNKRETHDFVGDENEPAFSEDA